MQFEEFSAHDIIYQQSLKLREDCLRKPLGLSLSKDDTSNDHKRFHYGIIDENDLIACVSIQPINNGTAQLRQMAVASAHQRKGIGTSLISAMEKNIKMKGIQKIIMDARVSAQIFYQKLGYETEGAIYSHLDIDHITMKKSL